MVTLGPIALTPRDIATACWLAVLVVAVLASGSTRQSLGGVLRAIARLLGILVLYAAWIALLVLLASRIPFDDGRLWDPTAAKDTVVWFVVAGRALLFAFPKAATEPNFYLRRALATVSGTALLEFYLGLATFDLWIEILLPIPFTVLAIWTVLATRDPTAKRSRAVLGWITILLVLAFAVGVGLVLANEWAGHDWMAQLRSFALTVWLTLGALPFVAWLSLYSNYQLAFAHMRARDGSGAPFKAKLAVISSFGARSRELHRFAGYWPRRVAEAGGFRAGRQIIREFRVDLANREAKERQKADDLVRYAGVQGTDTEGRQLDRREFAETINTLELLASAHMGWYRRDPAGRYKREVADVISVFARGLPEEHGIVMKVRKDGQAWYAWRRTITGWVLAVGAKGPPPNQWFYGGPEPPKAYPGADPGWSQQRISS
jgi:hypothetical protein